ncbi:MAG: hypothetical protein PVG30_03005 [Gammaproteobacteria bacterium]|jgi:hypothetical protein
MYYIKSLFFCGCQRKSPLEKAKERITKFAYNPNDMYGLLDPLIEVYNHIKKQLNSKSFKNNEYGGNEVAEELAKFINKLNIKNISENNYKILEKNINKLTTALSKKATNPKTPAKIMRDYSGAMKVLAALQQYCSKNNSKCILQKKFQ